jgi:transposase
MSMELRLQICARSRAAARSARRATGSGAPDRYGGHRRPLLGPHESTLRRLVETRPDITVAEVQAALHDRLGIRAGLSTIHNALRRIGLRHKKGR